MSRTRGASQAAVVLGLCLVWAPASRAQTYLCPPAPTGVPGLSGGPAFAATTLPDAFASRLDDPRWTGSWREDFSASQGTQAAARILNDGSNLFLSLQAVVDPDGAQIGSDAVYLGFSKDGTTGVIVKLVMDAAPPTGGFVNDATSISSASSWKTTNGGASGWPKQGPQSWATPVNIHLWTGAGTGNGTAWGYNAKMSLATLGTVLGLAGPLAPPFYLWYQINIETPQTTAQYAWPAGSTVAFDSTSTGCTSANPCALLPVAEWGIVNAPASANCPTGISIDATSIGTKPLASGAPGTTVVFGTGQSGNDFIAELINTDSLNPLNASSIQARFRIAAWPSTAGVGGSWSDLATTGTPAVAVAGTNATTGGEVSLPCVNPPFTSTSVDCYQPPTGAPASQGMLVELSQNNGSGYRFVHDSAWVDMTFVNPSTATGGAGGGALAGASGSAGTSGAAGAAGGSAGTSGAAGAAGGSAGTSGAAGASGGSAGNNGAAGVGAGGHAGQLGAGGGAAGQGGVTGAAGGGAGGKAGQGGQSGGSAAGGQPGVAGAAGQLGAGGMAGAAAGQSGTAGAAGQLGAGGMTGGQSGAAGAAGRSGTGGGSGAGAAGPGSGGSGGASQTGGASGSTGGGDGCSCGVGGSTPVGSLLFVAAGLLMLLRRGRVPHRRRARR